MVRIIVADHTGQITMSGGIATNDLRTYSYSQVDFSGGSVGSQLEADDNSVLTIYGSDFFVEGEPFGYGELTSILGGDYQDEPSRLLEGTLANEDPLDNDFYIGHDAKIVLAPAPPYYTLTMRVEPNDVGINTVTPDVGDHNYSGTMPVSAERFVDCPDVYVFDYWIGDVNDANTADTTIVMDANKTVTAVFVDDRQCGDECHPYPAGDVDENCEVNFLDIAVVVGSWLECTKPECD